jgi:hypothetical protein
MKEKKGEGREELKERKERRTGDLLRQNRHEPSIKLLHTSLSRHPPETGEKVGSVVAVRDEADADGFERGEKDVGEELGDTDEKVEMSERGEKGGKRRKRTLLRRGKWLCGSQRRGDRKPRRAST